MPIMPAQLFSALLTMGCVYVAMTPGLSGWSLLLLVC